MSRRTRTVSVMSIVIALRTVLWAADVPVIEHSPVRLAVPGQSVAIRARVTGGEARSVTLQLAPSRDTAPFRLPMAPVGGGVYAGTIPAANLAGLREAYYYIELRDAQDVLVETEWYTIQVRGAEEGGAAEPATEGGATRENKGRWVKPVLVGSGVLAAGGIAWAIADSSGGGGGGGGDAGMGDGATAGMYTGSDTTCVQAPGGMRTCTSSAATITISESGGVQSSDLWDGLTLSAQLAGNDFVLAATISDGAQNGEVRFVGSVVDTRIVGTIQGSATGADGVTTYDGNFSAVRQ